MKVKVLIPFRDKFNTSRLFTVGDVLEFDQERGEHIVELGLAEPVKKAYEAPVAEEAPKRKPRKKKAE